VFPDPEQLRPPNARERAWDMAEIDNLVMRGARNFPEHRELLADIPAKPASRPPQLYFW
jgi:hypothetical protein